jgi:uncharacterized short protein YbdD (DUF466 family)
MSAYLSRLARVVRAIIGVPDYDRYVAHCRLRHPGEPVMSREAFVRERLAARYERPGARCC